MSETKIKIPDLNPMEYEILMDALRFYNSNEKAVATDPTVDIKLRNKSRANATLSSELIIRIG